LKSGISENSRVGSGRSQRLDAAGSVTLDPAVSSLYNVWDIRRKWAMLDGIKRITVAIFSSTAVGVVLGVLIGALAGNYILWIAVMAGLGAAMGIAFGYGFLPES
jgi:hypothetical protein